MMTEQELQHNLTVAETKLAGAVVVMREIAGNLRALRRSTGCNLDGWACVLELAILQAEQGGRS